MKKLNWLFWLLVVIFVWVVVGRMTELGTLITTLAQGKWQWLLVATGLQILYYVVFTSLYRAAFALVGVRSQLRELLPVMFASIFVNVAAPLGGTSGQALFVDDARRRGESPTRAAAGTVLVLVAEFGSFLFILIPGMLVLFTIHDLEMYEIVTAALMFVLVGGLSLVLLLGIWQPAILHRLLLWVQKGVNWIGKRFKKQNLLAEDWAERTGNEYIEASLAVASRPSSLVGVFGIAFLAHIVDMLSLWMFFLAFNQPVSADILVAVYAICILFWVVSVTPQGIGVVEGVMALVLTSLGITAERSAVIGLSFRGISFWFPLFIGFILMRRLRIFNPKAKPISSAWGIRLVSTLVVLMGVANLVSAITPALPDRLRMLQTVFPVWFMHGNRLVVVFAGFALILLGDGLFHRKRGAWLLAVALLGFSAANHLLKGLDYGMAVLALLVVGWLVYLQPHFNVLSDPPSFYQGISALIVAVLFTLIYGTLGFSLLDNYFPADYPVGAALRQTWVMFTQFHDPGLQPLTDYGRFFADSVYVVGFGTVLFTIVLLIRPLLVHKPTTEAERKLARKIVRAYGKTSLAAFALLNDKRYFFSKTGSMIAYVVRNRVAVALGDPIGPEGDIAVTVRAFQQFCLRNDWIPSFYQVQPDHLSVYTGLGFRSLLVGNEAVVRVEEFDLEGDENTGLHSVYHRLTGMGYHVKVLLPPFDPILLRKLRDISDLWLALAHSSEKQFSLGWFEMNYMNSNPVMVVVDQEGEPVAFANMLSEYQKNELTVDLMRHLPDAGHGIMDFLFISLIQWAKENQYETFNLGLSTLSGTVSASDDPVIERAFQYIYRHVNRFYHFKGLHQYKAKFHPEWSARYLIYPDVSNLPFITLAVIRADSGSSLLTDLFR